MLSASDFRTDINGLRAWAVLGVIFYHFGVQGFEGGFAGVDVFFVISGYLMTGIILRGKTSGQPFSLSQFYLSRARRIIPALLATCVVVLVIGWLWLGPRDYRTLGKHVLSAITFTSNFRFHNESGYFDSDANEKWLLHTWSLSVEWQFYLLYPILIAGIQRLSQSNAQLRWSLWLLALASFSSCVLATPEHASFAFYQLPTRAWEMLAGGLVLLHEPQLTALGRLQRLRLSTIGLLLVLFAFMIPASPESWPGYRAAWPVAAAMLVIGANSTSQWLTRNRFAQLTGRASYSLYLWHWPIVVVITYLEQTAKPEAIATGLLLTFIAGVTSYHGIEIRSQKLLQLRPSRQQVNAMAVTIGLIALASGLVHGLKGIPQRFDSHLQAVYAASNDTFKEHKACWVREGRSPHDCLGQVTAPDLIILGDSHAEYLLGAIESIAPLGGKNLIAWTMSGCPFIADVEQRKAGDGSCKDYVKAASLWLSLNHPKVPVLIINRSSQHVIGPNELNRINELAHPNYFIPGTEHDNALRIKALQKGLADTACTLSTTHPVILLRPVPEMRRHVPNTLGKAILRHTDPELFIRLNDYFSRQQPVLEAQDAAHQACGLRILEVTPQLCPSGICHGVVDGMPIYVDDDHLNRAGAHMVIRPLADTLFPSTKP